MEHWSADGHEDAWRSASHRIEYIQGVTGVVTQVRHRTTKDGIAIAGGI